MDERGYKIIDLSPLLRPGSDFAVRCYTRDEAKHFVSTMLHQYPDATRSWSWPNIMWEEDSIRRYTDYYPDINVYSDKFMSWDASGWAEDHPETVVIDFADLLQNSVPSDLGDLSEFNTDVMSLIGIS